MENKNPEQPLDTGCDEVLKQDASEYSAEEFTAWIGRRHVRYLSQRWEDIVRRFSTSYPPLTVFLECDRFLQTVPDLLMVEPACGLVENLPHIDGSAVLEYHWTPTLTGPLLNHNTVLGPGLNPFLPHLMIGNLGLAQCQSGLNAPSQPAPLFHAANQMREAGASRRPILGRATEITPFEGPFAGGMAYFGELPTEAYQVVPAVFGDAGVQRRAVFGRNWHAPVEPAVWGGAPFLSQSEIYSEVPFIGGATEGQKAGAYSFLQAADCGRAAVGGTRHGIQRGETYAGSGHHFGKMDEISFTMSLGRAGAAVCRTDLRFGELPTATCQAAPQDGASFSTPVIGADPGTRVKEKRERTDLGHTPVLVRAPVPLTGSGACVQASVQALPKGVIPLGASDSQTQFGLWRDQGQGIVASAGHLSASSLGTLPGNWPDEPLPEPVMLGQFPSVGKLETLPRTIGVGTHSKTLFDSAKERSNLLGTLPVYPLQANNSSEVTNITSSYAGSEVEAVTSFDNRYAVLPHGMYTSPRNNQLWGACGSNDYGYCRNPPAPIYSKATLGTPQTAIPCQAKPEISQCQNIACSGMGLFSASGHLHCISDNKENIPSDSLANPVERKT